MNIKKDVYEKHKEWILREPYICFKNIYYWHGFFGNGTQRYRKACDYAFEVYNWLKDKFGDRVKLDENKVYLDDVRVFFIDSSRNHVYKRQNKRYIYNQLKEVE